MPLVAQSAVRRNPKRDIGNDVLDGHVGAAILVALGWFASISLVAIVVILRGVSGADNPARRRLPWYQRPS